jgi:four helix bundle protein
MQTYTEKLRALEDRTIVFSATTVKVCGKYAQDRSLQPLVNQVIRSATSVGANYAEANNASSKADFRNKIFISKKEAAESVYWFRILHELTTDDSLQELRQEAYELNLIFQKIISTMKSEPSNGK